MKTLSEYYKEKYGFRVFKIGLSTGIKCPYNCHFCVPNTYIEESYTKSSINEQINQAIQNIKQKVKASGYIAYFQDGTSLYGDPEYLYNLFKQADEHPDILEIIISTRPDCLPETTLNLLQKLNKPVTLEIGVQTTNNQSLAYLNRKHTQEDNQKAIDLLQNYSFKVGIHIILGIPNDNIDNIIYWINKTKIISDVKIHHLAVYKNSKLSEIISKEDIIDLDCYLEIIKYFLPKLRNDITISRLFSSNLSRDNSMLNNFPGNKRMWLNAVPTASRPWPVAAISDRHPNRTERIYPFRIKYV